MQFSLPGRHSAAHALHQVVFHAAISVLAIGVAFSLPRIARFVLYEWWPRVVADSQLLLATELAVAAALVLLLNLGRVAWEGLRIMRMNRVASLVHVREGARASSRRPRLPAAQAARDALIVSVTGYEVFAAEGAPFRDTVAQCYETRVMLLNPESEGAAARIRSLEDPERAREAYRRETEASIACLRALAAAGRKVTLKLYETPPFWNIVVAGDHAWVKYCHHGRLLQSQPEFVFALRRDRPCVGLFPPFLVYALDQWGDPRHPEYDFATGELVHRDAEGRETRRAPFPASGAQGLRGA